MFYMCSNNKEHDKTLLVHVHIGFHITFNPKSGEFRSKF